VTIYHYIQASIEHADRCEDAFMIFPGNGKAPVYSAIDGMGGHQRQTASGEIITGREAAQMLRSVLIEDLQHLPADVEASRGGLAEQRVIAAINRAHQRVYNELNLGGAVPIHECVGAVVTVVVACENGQRLLTVQVGDTRGYLFSVDELIQLCPDEDNIEHLIRQGAMSIEDGARVTEILNSYDGINIPKAEGTITINGQPYELYLAWRWFMVGNSALNIPGANIVINALGIHAANPQPQSSRIEIAPGDKLFLCSDGLYKNLTEAEILAGLQQPGDGAARLGEAAYARSQDHSNRRRTPDDITAIIVEF
jgi:serine/threonine protein phosphatase PrpC